MKTCKRCKKPVPNNMKKCKYCGANLLKNKSNNSNKNSKNKQTKTEFIPKKEEKVDILETKTEFLYTKDYKNYNENKEKKVDLKTKDNNNEITKHLEKLSNNNNNLDVDMPDLLFTKKVVLQKKGKTQLLKLKKSKLKNNLGQKETIKIKEEEVKNKVTRAQQLARAKRLDRECKCMKILVVIISIICLGYAVFRLYDSVVEKGTVIKLNDKDRQKVFKMNEIITYKDISYSVISVETSQGTRYKKPKEGNQFLIITIDMTNNSREKYRYSHNDWKMTNSTGEEQERIISPVNAKNALYSGNLVIGGTKSGSLVFEQPIEEEKLELRYYEPTKEEKQELEVEEQPEDEKEETKEPIFSVIIKTK